MSDAPYRNREIDEKFGDIKDALFRIENEKLPVLITQVTKTNGRVTKLERYMAQTEAYWSAKKQADGVTLAREALASASQSLTAAKANNLAAAKDAFDRMGATCNSCHDLHLEKR